MSEAMQRYKPELCMYVNDGCKTRDVEMVPLDPVSSEPGFYAQSDVCKLEAQLATVTAERDKLREALIFTQKGLDAYSSDRTSVHLSTATFQLIKRTIAAALGDTTGGTGR